MKRRLRKNVSGYCLQAAVQSVQFIVVRDDLDPCEDTLVKHTGEKKRKFSVDEDVSHSSNFFACGSSVQNIDSLVLSCFSAAMILTLAMLSVLMITLKAHTLRDSVIFQGC